MENTEKPLFWHGFMRRDFQIEGRNCTVVIPEKPLPSMSWVWRARFWDVEPQAELALLDMGFHIAYIDCVDFYGSHQAMEIWDSFYEHLTKDNGLAEKTVLIGFSRGGLFVFNWAARNPDKVACIYADAPVCDLKSWPGGKGKGPGSPADWQKCQEAYELNEKKLTAWDKNPVDTIPVLAKAGIPILIIAGDADEVVPIEENSDVIFKKCKELGGDIAMFVKRGCEHHPHSLRDPSLPVDFILRHSVRPAHNWFPASYANKEVLGGTYCDVSILNKKYLLELR